jgi:hypothetical protein
VAPAWQQHCRDCRSGSAAAAQQRQQQFCSGSGGQLGGCGGSLAAAAWRQHGRGSRLLLVDCCLFVSTAVADIGYPRAWKKHVLGFCAGIEHKKLLIKTLFQVFDFVLLMNYVFIWCCSGISYF